MRKITYSILILFIFQISVVKSQNLSFKTDQWDKEKTNILNEDGDIVGYAKQDKWEKHIVILYDANGNVIRKIQADQWDNEKTNFYNDFGNLERSEKQDRWNKQRTNIYDDENNLIGYREPDQWNNEKINVYNNHGTQIGFYSRDEWSGDLKYTDLNSSKQLQIYTPKSYQSPNVEFTPTFEVPIFDLSSLERMQNQRIEQISRELTEWESKVENAATDEERRKIAQEFRVWSNATFPPKKEVKEYEFTFIKPGTEKKTRPTKLKKTTSIEIIGNTKIIHFPKVSKYDLENIQVTKVELRKRKTIVTIRYINDESAWVNIDKFTILNEVNENDDILNSNQIRKANSIPFAPYKHRFNEDFEILEFSLVFPKIDRYNTAAIDIIECDNDSCFNIYGIDIR